MNSQGYLLPNAIDPLQVYHNYKVMATKFLEKRQFMNCIKTVQ